MGYIMKNFLWKKKNKKVSKPSLYGWFGTYSSWELAQQATAGYDQKNILKKTQYSLAKIRDGEAVYERDSVLFDKKEHPFALISSLLYIAIQKSNTLNILDFGGSLGSTYFQVRDFLKPLNKLRWHIVEQSSYVDIGKCEFENEQLKFFHTIAESVEVIRPDVILLSSVVQYLKDPHQFLINLAKLQIPYLIFDRTAFIHEGDDRLTIQRVPPEIYEASYPSWFFNEELFLKHFNEYTILADFSSYVVGEADMYIDGQLAGYDKGFLLQYTL